MFLRTVSKLLLKDSVLRDLFIPGPICNLNQFECIMDLLDSNVDGELSETCSLPSCVAMEIEVISDFESDVEDSLGLLKVEIMNKPTLRYVRRVVETKLDIVGNILRTWWQSSVTNLTYFS